MSKDEYSSPPNPEEQLRLLIQQMIQNEEYKLSPYLHGLLNGCILSHAMFGGTNGEYPNFIPSQPDYYENILQRYTTDNIQ